MICMSWGFVDIIVQENLKRVSALETLFMSAIRTKLWENNFDTRKKWNKSAFNIAKQPNGLKKFLGLTRIINEYSQHI